MRRRTTVAIVAILMVLSAFGLGYYLYLEEKKPNTREVSYFNDAQTRLVIEDQLISSGQPPIVRDNQILLPLETIKAYIDSTIWWDAALKKVTVTTKDRVIRMKTDSLDALINDKPITLEFPVIEENDTVYLPLDFLKEFYQVNLKYVSANDVVIIDFQNKLYRTCRPLTQDSVVRRGPSIKEPIVKRFTETDIQEGAERLILFEEYEKWLRIRTPDGVVGYIQKSDAVVLDIVLTKGIESGLKELPQLPKGKISLVWDMTYGKQNIELSKTATPGIDVISPTWFEIIDQKGTIKNRGSEAYVAWAHENGWQVWALFANSFKDIEGTSLLLNNSDKRQEIIRSLLAYAALYKLDGINVDFENIPKEDRDAYTQFIRELYPLLKEQNLMVSVDVGVPGGSATYSQCYDHKTLSESVDYVCLMTYDQHWSTSTVAGSTAELGWVEDKLVETLKLVKPEKLLMGIPLYTRVWYEEEADGKTTLKSKALTVDNAWKAIEENDAQVVWNASIGQYEASYEKDGTVNRMWLEDKDAVNMKTSLVHKYQLAGASVWAVNFADASVWPVFERNLKKVAHYEEWKQLYSSPTRQ